MQVLLFFVFFFFTIILLLFLFLSFAIPNLNLNLGDRQFCLLNPKKQIVQSRASPIQPKKCIKHSKVFP